MKILILVILEGTNKYRQRSDILSKTEQLNKGPLFRNTENKKFYYDDIIERKIDGTEEIKQFLNEEYLLQNNDVNNNEKCCIELDFKDLKKETIYGDNEETTEQLNEGTLLRNTENKKRYYNDINEGKINETEETEEIKHFLNEEYLLENNDDNDEECCTELDFKDLKKETIYGDNEETTEKLNEGTVTSET